MMKIKMQEISHIDSPRARLRPDAHSVVLVVQLYLVVVIKGPDNARRCCVILKTPNRR